MRCAAFGSVRVVGQQYVWQLSTTHFHVGETVDFAVTSLDVNHGYGLYDPAGVLIAQVQAMPEYVNHLIVTFRLPGTYIVRCLEYCGQLHQVMEVTFTVARSRS
jgi:cytochrome c oxidase subunit 2